MFNLMKWHVLTVNKFNQYRKVWRSKYFLQFLYDQIRLCFQTSYEYVCVLGFVCIILEMISSYACGVVSCFALSNMAWTSSMVLNTEFPLYFLGMQSTPYIKRYTEQNLGDFTIFTVIMLWLASSCTHFKPLADYLFMTNPKKLSVWAQG